MTKHREIIIGFGITPIAPKATIEVIQTTESIFRADRLIIPSHTAADFDVVDLRVNGQSVFHNPAVGPLPGIIFVETAHGIGLRPVIADKGAKICLVVTNTNLEAAERKFTAAIVGTTAETMEELLPPPEELPVQEHIHSPQSVEFTGGFPNRPRASADIKNPMTPDLADGIERDARATSDEAPGWSGVKARFFHVLETGLSVFENAAQLIADKLSNKSEEAEEEEGEVLFNDAHAGREYILGFDVSAVPGQSSANITKRPQVAFRPERLVIPADIGRYFMVVDIKIGRNSQFIASGEVPGITFSEMAYGVRLKMDVCQVSMDLTISVRNVNSETRNFTAAIIGPAVYDDDDLAWKRKIRTDRFKKAFLSDPFLA